MITLISRVASRAWNSSKRGIHKHASNYLKLALRNYAMVGKVFLSRFRARACCIACCIILGALRFVRILTYRGSCLFISLLCFKLSGAHCPWFTIYIFFQQKHNVAPLLYWLCSECLSKLERHRGKQRKHK